LIHEASETSITKPNPLPLAMRSAYAMAETPNSAAR
jgi:hypothetical protein